MASRSRAMLALKETLAPLVSGFTVGGSPVAVSVGLGRAPMNVIQDTARLSKAVVAIYGRPGGSSYNTGLTTQKVDETKDKSLVVELSADTIAPGESVNLTISFADGFNAVQVGDAIGIGAELPLDGDGAVAIAEDGETIATLIDKLLAAIADSSKLSTWLAAGTAGGGVVTLTGIGTRSALITASSCAQAFRHTAYGRARCPVQVDLWAGSEKISNALADIFEGALCRLQRDSLWLESEGKPRERVLIEAAPPVELYDDLLKDVYRQCFLAELDYKTTAREEVYEVLIGVARGHSWPPP